MNTNSVKSSTAAGLLGIFLGAFGAHDWYLGNTKKGLMHICLFAGGFILMVISAPLVALTINIPVVPAFFGLLTAVAYLALVGNAVWGFVEGVIIIAQGDAGLAAKGYKVAPVTYAAPQTPTVTPTTPTDTVAEAPEKPAAEKADTKPEAKTEKSEKTTKSDKADKADKK